MANLSRRSLLGAVGGTVAATAIPTLPAWAEDDIRPGAD